jgi:hypothetical protein
MKTEHIITIEPDGTIKHVYDDELADMFADDGKTTTRRASHVEPVESADDGGWCADMAPSGGPILGPFTTRGEALQAEVTWLKEEMTR